jgi:hypothetical protein
VNSRLTDSEYRVLVEQAPMLIWRANLTAARDYFRELKSRGRTMGQEYGNSWTEGVPEWSVYPRAGQLNPLREAGRCIITPDPATPDR